MTDNSTSRPRAPIDLDEFERQLREMQTQPKHTMSDPLAELARIVGQDDPFLLSRDNKKQPEQALNAGDSIKSSVEEKLPTQEHAASIFDELTNLRRQTTRGATDQGTFELDALPAGYQSHMSEDNLHEQPFSGEPPEFLAGSHVDYSDNYDNTQPSRSGLKIFGAMVALGSLAVAGVWGYSGLNNGPVKIADNTPVIAAKAGPVKEKPINPGGAEVPNLNADILQKNRDASKEFPKLVPREEQPVDLSQAIKKDIRRVDLGQVSENGAAPVVLVPVPNAQTNANTVNLQAISNPVSPLAVIVPAPKPQAVANSLPATAAPSAASSVTATGAVVSAPAIPAISSGSVPSLPSLPVPETSSSLNGGPKKVKSVRITTGEPSVQAPAKTDTPAPKTVQKAVAPKPAKTTPAQQKTMSDVALRSDVPEINSEAPLQITPPAGVSRKGQKIAANTMPIVASPAAKAPKPVKVPVEDAETAVEPQTETAPTRSTGAGKFSVQFGAPGSTTEAQSLISRLKSKYPSVMGSVDARVVKAQVNGRDVYRVRSGAVSKDQANALCADLKAAGGSCFISGG